MNAMAAMKAELRFDCITRFILARAFPAPRMLAVKTSPVASTVSFLSAPPLEPGIAQRAELDLDFFARFDRVAAPAAGAHQISGAGHFHHPDCRPSCLALLDDAFDRQADMRIDPAQFHDLAVDRHGLGMIEHRGGVMRRDRREPSASAPAKPRTAIASLHDVSS